MIRKIISTIAGFILLLCITTLGAIYSIRSLLSGPNLVDFMKQDINFMDQTIDTSSIFSSSLVPSELESYVDEKALEEAYGELFSDTIKYVTQGSTAERPNSDKLKELFSEYIKTYEQETGLSFDSSALDQSFVDYDESVDELLNRVNEENKIVVTAISYLYNDTILYLIIGITILSVIIIFVSLGSKIVESLRKVSVIIFINGMGMSGMSTALKSVVSMNQDSANIITNKLSSIFRNIAVICITLAIVGYIITIIVKVIEKQKKKNTIIEESSNEPSNTQVEGEIINNEFITPESNNNSE